MSNVQLPARLARVLSGRHLPLCATGLLLGGVLTALVLNFPHRTAPAEAAPLATEAAAGADASPLVHARAEVRPGDTVPALMDALGISDEALRGFLVSDPEAARLVRRLRPGTILKSGTDADGQLAWLKVRRPGSAAGKRIARTDDAGFAMEDFELDVESRQEFAEGVITRSLFAATDASGLPDSLAVKMADIFASQIDFNTGLRQGDRFAVVYDSYHHGGERLRTGRIQAVEFVSSGQRYSAYWFDDGQGRGAYYDANGRSLRQGFLRSPLEFTRISSGFSPNRLHPVHKQWRAHKGTDFAAPTGTRVRASSDGKVAFVGQQRGYGKIIEIEHAGGYTTAYGHLNGFAKGLKKGQAVSQGDVIGFVGSTGWATGPHLHYEFRQGGQHFDPMRVKLPGQPPLTGARLQAFLAHTAPLVARLEAAGPVQVAAGF